MTTQRDTEAIDTVMAEWIEAAVRSAVAAEMEEREALLWGCVIGSECWAIDLITIVHYPDGLEQRWGIVSWLAGNERILGSRPRHAR
jgi:hypothetical protein